MRGKNAYLEIFDEKAVVSVDHVLVAILIAEGLQHFLCKDKGRHVLQKGLMNKR